MGSFLYQNAGLALPERVVLLLARDLELLGELPRKHGLEAAKADTISLPDRAYVRDSSRTHFFKPSLSPGPEIGINSRFSRPKEKVPRRTDV